MVAVRAAVGILEVISLAFVPAAVIPILSGMVGEPYAVSQSIQFACLWACSGGLIFGLAQLLSSTIQGVASVWITCFLILMLYSSIVNVTALSAYRSLDFFKIMSGAGFPYFDSSSHAIVGPLPWLPLAVFVVFGARVSAKAEYS
ncbi:MAG: hypothetical protein JNK48_25130 [Bryobacterales bacterium]|nr:hypothetical protein [Bryobacterales bacterium]